MATMVFSDIHAFQERKDKSINGMSPEFVEANRIDLSLPRWQSVDGNVDCWNCTGNHNTKCVNCIGCEDCISCIDCANLDASEYCRRCYVGRRLSGVRNVVPDTLHVACFTGLYNYTCSPRILQNGEQLIQMGCKLLTRKQWETNPWNNPEEFPNDGSIQSQRRMFALQTAYAWLDMMADVKYHYNS